MQQLLWKWRGKRLVKVVDDNGCVKEYRWMNGKRLSPKQVRELEEDEQDNLWL